VLAHHVLKESLASTTITTGSNSSSTGCPQQQQQQQQQQRRQGTSMPKLLSELLQLLGWSDGALIHIASQAQQQAVEAPPCAWAASFH
jgi:hypothetical protein